MFTQSHPRWNRLKYNYLQVLQKQINGQRTDPLFDTAQLGGDRLYNRPLQHSIATASHSRKFICPNIYSRIINNSKARYVITIYGTFRIHDVAQNLSICTAVVFQCRAGKQDYVGPSTLQWISGFHRPLLQSITFISRLMHSII